MPFVGWFDRRDKDIPAARFFKSTCQRLREKRVQKWRSFHVEQVPWSFKISSIATSTGCTRSAGRWITFSGRNNFSDGLTSFPLPLERWGPGRPPHFPVCRIFGFGECQMEQPPINLFLLCMTLSVWGHDKGEP